MKLVNESIGPELIKHSKLGHFPVTVDKQNINCNNTARLPCLFIGFDLGYFKFTF